MKRYLLTIEYDGTNFSGWQKQKGQRTVQEEIEKVLENISGHNVKLEASGRTDAKVHALNQTAHVDLEINIPVCNLVNVINNLLPSDICIKKVKIVKDNFHARFDIKEKTYLYKIYTGETRSALKENYYCFIKYDLDFSLMQECANLLIGEHDFSAFCSSKTNSENHIRTIYSLLIKKKNKEIYFEVTGNGFLYNMVRIIVGTIIDVGRGFLSLEKIKEALKTGDRSLTGTTLIANGLYLKQTKY
ncbi:MAG: tRNA pseudouridine(38-40) synthase TruA [Clostridia bacterium]|nr:tRNA pseudouridine(38-40) synthase TruA [Clostridia bacterium]